MANTLNLEVRAQVDDAIRAMGRLNKSFDLMGKANQDAAGALGEFGISLTALNNPLTLVASGLKASMDEAIGWSNTIDDVQKITGETAQETSKLVTVLGDFGIEANTLKGAAKALKEQGLTPNLETLKKLAAQYQAIEDPAERVAWGTKTLGRAFFDLSEVLTKTPAEFEAVEQAARTSGKIIGQDMVDQMEAAQIKAQQLQDKLDGLKIAIGVPFVNTLSAAVDGGENWVKVMGAINLVIQKQTGIIDEDQAALRAAALAAGDIAAVYAEQFDPAVTNTTDAVDRQNERLLALNSSVTKTTPNIAAIKAETARWEAATKFAADEIERAAQKETMAIDLLSAAMGGAVANENEAFTNSQIELSQKMADVRNEIDKLSVSNGQYVSYTEDAKFTTEEYQLQLEKVTKAQIALSENTDDSKTLALTVALQNATEKANGMAAGLGGVSSYMVDNGEKILTLNSEYNELSNQFNANAAAHEEATARIVFGMLQQQLAMDGLSKEEVAFLTDVGEEWGIYDEKTAAVMRSVQDSITEHGLNSKAVLDELAKSVNDLPETKTVTITTIRRQIDEEAQGATGTQGGQHGGAVGDGYASGGMAYGPTSGHWELLHGDERVLSPEQTKAYNAGQTGNPYGGGITINVNGAGDPQAVAQQVSIILAAKTRAYKQAGVTL